MIAPQIRSLVRSYLDRVSPIPDRPLSDRPTPLQPHYSLPPANLCSSYIHAINNTVRYIHTDTIGHIPKGTYIRRAMHTEGTYTWRGHTYGVIHTEETYT